MSNKTKGPDLGTSRPTRRSQTALSAHYGQPLEDEDTTGSASPTPNVETATPAATPTPQPAATPSRLSSVPEPRSASPEATVTAAVVPSATATSPSASESRQLAPRKKLTKVPISTQISLDTQRRLEYMLKTEGYLLTDVVDLALNNIMDTYGIPADPSSGR